MSNKKSDIVISNFKLLDAVKDKDKIEQLKREKKDAIHNPLYAVDLNTNNVKQNNNTTFIIDLNKKVHNISDAINSDLYTEYLNQMQEFKNNIKEFKDKEYTSFIDLDNDIVRFNNMFDNAYLNGFNLRVKNYLDDKIKKDYINKYAEAVATAQIQEIKNVLNDVIDIVNVDLDNTDIIIIVNKEWIKFIQDAIKVNYTDTTASDIDTSDAEIIKAFTNDFNKDDVDIFIFNTIQDLLYQEQIEVFNALIDKNTEYYKKVNSLYKSIDKSILNIAHNFNVYYQKYKNYDNAPIPKAPKDKQINLHLAKMFNNTYPLNKYTSIDKNNNDDKYEIKLNFTYENEFKELRDLILVDEVNNKQISLLPIDLALFIGFTTLNNINGSNTPITLTDAFKYISEDKKIRIRKTQKAYQLYDDKMQLFKSFKVKSIIKDKKTKKILIEFKDAIPILENYRVEIPSRNDRGYIIGASAILSILNYLSELEDIDYLTTFSVANNFINDSQSNTIEILNMKYYLIIKVLQMGNASKNGKIYNPHINLDDLFKQTAQLKGVAVLSRDDKKRLRQKIEIYLNHLQNKGLLTKYDYQPFNEIPISDDNNNAIVKKSNSKSDLYIKI